MFWTGSSFTELAIGAVTYGFGMSGMAPLQSVAVAAVFGAQSYGRANGLMQPFMLPVALVASPVAAWIYDRSGDYTDAFLIFLALMVVALPIGLALRLAPPRDRRVQAAAMDAAD